MDTAAPFPGCYNEFTVTGACKHDTLMCIIVNEVFYRQVTCVKQKVDALPTCNWFDEYACPIPWLKEKFPVAGTCKDGEPLWISKVNRIVKW